jgi:L-threonylcarbamoyladenylate synthase
MISPRILRVGVGSDDAVVDEVARALESGQLAVIPTDTVYGVAADPRIDGAEELLCEAKGRDKNKPLPLLAADVAQVEEYGAVLGTIEKKLAAAFWPGPLTMVLPLKDGATCEGFRVSDSDFVARLLRRMNCVLRVTSANRSGGSDPVTAEDAVDELAEFVAVTVDAGKLTIGIPSSVIKVADGQIELLRKGALSLDDLTAVLQK